MTGARHLEHGRPAIKFNGTAKKRMQQLGVSAVWLSISYEKSYSVATVVLET